MDQRYATNWLQITRTFVDHLGPFIFHLRNPKKNSLVAWIPPPAAKNQSRCVDKKHLVFFLPDEISNGLDIPLKVGVFERIVFLSRAHHFVSLGAKISIRPISGVYNFRGVQPPNTKL